MQIEIYTKGYCPYCHRAKRVLDARGLTYTEYDITNDRQGQQQMIERTGGYTVPQIVINGQPIGGSDELVQLNSTGALDAAVS